MKKILTLILLFVSISAHSQNIIECKDGYNLMEKIDILHAPYKKKYYKHRTKNRRSNIPFSLMNQICNSDTIYIMITQGEDFVIDGFIEFVSSNNGCYYKGAISNSFEFQNGNLISDCRNILNKVKEKKYIKHAPSFHDEKRIYDVWLLIRLIRIAPLKYHCVTYTMYEDSWGGKTLYIEKEFNMNKSNMHDGRLY